MIICGNNVYRSLEEQVYKNQSDIKDLTRQVGLIGIKVVKQIDSLEDLPLPGSDEFNALKPGDAYAVGVAESEDPIFYEVKVADDSTGHWLNMGTFIGEPGEQGPEGPFGKSVFVTSQEIEETTTNAYLSGITLPDGRDLQKDDILLSYSNFGMAQVTGVGDESALITYLGNISTGGGDGDLFLITINYSGGVYSADKTYAEILNARNAGKACVLLYGGSEYLFVGLSADTMSFNRVITTSSTTVYGEYFTIDDTEQINFYQNSYPIFNSITTYTVAPPTILLENNNTKVINYTTEPLNYTIKTSDIDTSKEFITSIIFTATAGQHINEQIDAAYVIKYSNAITFTEGKTYEIIYRCLWAKDSNDKTIVSATWNEV